jgi:hypothetical protein
MKLLNRLAGECALRGRRLGEAWSRFWFTPTDVAVPAAIRICTGLVLLYVYGTVAPDLQSYLGPHAWVDPQALEEIRHPAEVGMGEAPWWGWSVWLYVTAPAGVWLLHAAFLAAIVCFTVGLWTRAANAVVWVGHLSFLHRAFVSWSGMDTILAMLTFYLLLAPCGSAFSLDRRRARTAVARESWTANLAVRLIQVHLCVIYLCAGLSKLQGSHWWDGTAVWRTMAMHEFAPFDATWPGHLGDDFCLLLSNVGVLLTLGFEIGFAFLVWDRRARPALLALAVLLHAGIGFFMGMGAFGAAMLTACLSFVDADQVRAVVARLTPGARGPGEDARASAPARRAA